MGDLENCAKCKKEMDSTLLRPFGHNRSRICFACAKEDPEAWERFHRAQYDEAFGSFAHLDEDELEARRVVVKDNPRYPGII